MKKILAIIVLLCALGVSASAADMTFTPEGEGKWIYCNNPEAIRNQDLMNSDDNPPSYIMNNENLEPDLYDFLICHIITLTVTAVTVQDMKLKLMLNSRLLRTVK